VVAHEFCITLELELQTEVEEEEALRGGGAEVAHGPSSVPVLSGKTLGPPSQAEVAD